MSLLEITIAIGLLGSGFLMVIGLFPSSVSALKKGESLVLATELTQREMERVRNTPYAAFAPYSFDESLSLTASGGQVSRVFQVSVQDAGERIAGRLREVVVMVSWREGSAMRYVKMGTLVSSSLK
ncbi:MAG: hypothetical protein FJX76_05705 [Armatimonadetes bacterium]|nr:hypothetical protein [Armatimonadota bacterium]